MQGEFEMFMMGKLSFFLGLHAKLSFFLGLQGDPQKV